MASPRNLKNMMIFNSGTAYVGDAMSFTQPKLVRKLEEHRAGGMDRAVKIDMGGEPLECEFTTASPMRDIFRQYGGGISDVQLRLVGTYQNDELGTLDTIEISVRGRHEEIDPGESKPGEKTEMKVKMALTYYKLEWNGRVEIEIDAINMIEIVDGVDLMAASRAALGLF